MPFCCYGKFEFSCVCVHFRRKGHLALSGGTLTGDFAEFEVKRALEWLQGNKRVDMHMQGIHIHLSCRSSATYISTIITLYYFASLDILYAFALKLYIYHHATGERNEVRRHTAILVLRELATNAPTLFYPHVPQFFDVIFSAIRDPKFAIRMDAVAAFRACLAVTAQRESRIRLTWYTKVWNTFTFWDGILSV